MKKKRKPPKVKEHLWEVEVRHRDYPATVNSSTKTLYMKRTKLWIASPQPPWQTPSIDLALARARRFLNRNRREYSIPTILNVVNHGFLDEVQR